MRARYNALRADRLTASHFDAEKSLLASGILLAFAIGLFAAHWRWLRGLREPAAVA